MHVLLPFFFHINYNFFLCIYYLFIFYNFSISFILVSFSLLSFRDFPFYFIFYIPWLIKRDCKVNDRTSFSILISSTDTCLPWERLQCFVLTRSTKGCSWCCRVSYFTNQEYRELGQQLSPRPRHRVLSLRPSLLYQLLECRFDLRSWFCFQFE